MMKFVHALNVVVAYIGMEKFGNAQTVTTQRKTKKEVRKKLRIIDEKQSSLSDEVIIEIVHSIKDIVIELIDKAFTKKENRRSE